MSDWLIPPPVRVGIPVAGTQVRFPVQRIFCVGRNYAAHAREMGSDPERSAPFFFCKHADAAVYAPGGDAPRLLPWPHPTTDLHHEVELALAIGITGRDLDADDSARAIVAHGVAIDLTRRDLQRDAKAAGRPWAMAKGFDAAAPIGSLEPGPPPEAGAIGLKIDAEVRQKGDLSQMIWAPAEIVAQLSRLLTVRAGDLILTGTPAGVGPILPGEHVIGSIEGCGSVEIRMQPP